MERRSGISLVALSVLLALMALPAPAFAATAFAATSRVSLYDVRLLMGDTGRQEMLVAAVPQPSSAKLAEVQLPVPKGSRIDWAGQILGGPPSQDPRATYRLVKAPGYDFVVFELTKAKRGQVEYPLSPLNVSKLPARVRITWKAPGPADSAQLVIQFPSGSKGKALTPGTSRSSSANGPAVYIRRFTDVKEGQRLDAAVQYRGGSSTGAAPPQAQQQPQPQQQLQPQQQNPQQPQRQSQTSGPQPASPAVAVLALGAILGLTFYLLNRVRPDRQTGTSSEETQKTPRRQGSGN